jgi:hypothetical protein
MSFFIDIMSFNINALPTLKPPRKATTAPTNSTQGSTNLTAQQSVASVNYAINLINQYNSMILSKNYKGAYKLLIHYLETHTINITPELNHKILEFQTSFLTRNSLPADLINLPVFSLPFTQEEEQSINKYNQQQANANAQQALFNAVAQLSRTQKP